MKPRILIVDDNRLNVEVLEELLRADYALATADSGEAGLEVANTFAPDLALLDIMMPGIDGYETCRRIKANPHLRATRVILVSASNRLEDRLTGYEAGADDYLARPFDPEELLAKIRVFVRLKSADDHKRILIVDNDPAVLRLLKQQLTAGGYAVLSATNGLEALRILLADGPPIVITDWNMPELDGLEFCRAVRGMDGIGFVYIIMLTGHPAEVNVVEAFAAGADDFLTKPWRPEELLARLSPGNRILSLESDLEQRNRALHKTNAELSILSRKLEALATTDALTGLANRRQAMVRLAEHWEIAMRCHQPIACVVLDLDHFKRINDVYGHAAGDTVLRKVAATLKRAARTGETVCRIGGEEFLLICVHATTKMATAAAERLRRAVASMRITHEGQPLPVTCSGGVAGSDQTMPTVDALLKCADDALYEAKHAGRNRICVAGESSAPCGADGGSGASRTPVTLHA